MYLLTLPAPLQNSCNSLRNNNVTCLAGAAKWTNQEKLYHKDKDLHPSVGTTSEGDILATVFLRDGFGGLCPTPGQVPDVCGSVVGCGHFAPAQSGALP